MDPLSQAIADLKDQVAQDQTVETSAITLLNQLGELILQYKDDPAQLETLAAQINSNAAALAAAVSANTPGAAPVPQG